MQLAKILSRHPDANVRKLPGKTLEWKDSQGEDQFFTPEDVDGKRVYTVPLPYARILLGGQPERYFLLEPAQLSVKRTNAKTFTTEHVLVKSVLGTKLAGTFASEPTVPASQESNGQEEEDARMALESMSLEAPTTDGKPPEEL